MTRPEGELSREEKRRLLARKLEERQRGGGLGFPLSFAQQRLWFLEQLDPGSDAYLVFLPLRLRGGLDPARLETSLNALVRRHEMLRTAFRAELGRPAQVILPDVVLPLPVVDLRGLPEAPRTSEVRRLSHEQARSPFDLDRPPLLRARLFRLDDREHLLLLSLHHIVTDAWSLGILVRDLGELYEAAGAGRAPALPALPIQYVDFAVWQRRHLQGEALAPLLAYWRQRLEREIPPLDLPADRPRPELQASRGGLLSCGVSAPLADRLRRLGEEEGATLFMVLLAAFAALLHRSTGQTDLAVGSPIAGRDREELEDLVGCFANTLVLRVDLAGDPTGRELLRRVRDTALGAYAYQQLPFDRLVEELKPRRDLGRNPFFQVMLSLQNVPMPRFAAGGLSWQPADLAVPPASFDLEIQMFEDGRSVGGSLLYSRALFDTPTAQRLAAGLQTLLEGLAAGPGQRLSELPVLPEAERHALLVEWCDPVTGGLPVADVEARFAAWAERQPDRPALIAAGRQLSYGDLDARANRLAHHLRSLGVSLETRVGVYTRDPVDRVTAVLAVLKADGAYVPLDPLHPRERVALILQDAGVTVLVTERELAAELPAHSLRAIRVVDLRAEEDAVARCPSGRPESRAEGSQLAYVLHTSGSTGRPKGVMIPRAALAAVFDAWERAYGYRPEDRHAQLASPAFDVFTAEWVRALCSGGALVLCPREVVLDPGRLVDLLRRERVTCADMVPSLMRNLAEFLEGRGEFLDTLRVLPIGAESWYVADLERFARITRGRTRLLNGYGVTEAAIESTFFSSSQTRLAPERVVPIGRPLAGRAHVLDPWLRPVPAGVPGALYLAGPVLARGYGGRPDLTADRFLPDPFADRPGQRLYRTGDLARYLPDGNLEFLGRGDDQVKIRGIRIEPGEIEAVLASHPGVREAAVVLRRDEREQPRLAAYAALTEGSALAAGELRAFLRDRLPEAMVPSSFLLLPELPRTAGGKVDRQALPAPDETGTDQAAPEPPVDALEGAILGLWKEVLRREPLGVEDNFFDVGGHSLLLTRVHARLREDLGIEIPLTDLFRHPTVRSLARALRPSGHAHGQEPAPRRAQAAVRTDDAVAIVGLAGRFPGAADPWELWRNLWQGVESISRFSAEELRAAGVDAARMADPRFVPAGGALGGVDLFDAGFFGYSRREAELLDPQQRVFLECAWEALERAGYDPARYGGRIGTFAGAGLSTYFLNHVLPNPVLASVGLFQAVLGSQTDFLPARAAYKLGLRGPSIGIQTACSTSLVAVCLAAQSLLDGHCDMALAGGVTIVVPERAGYLWEEGGLVSPDGHCRAFDADAGGLVSGNGAGIVVLKRLRDAVADGDWIHAVVKGFAVNNDGSAKVGFTAPGVDGQAEVVAAALAMAGVDPATVGYVEAHGTGTPLGDPVEVAALRQAFGPRANGTPTCALGSVKTNLGHLDAAAGVAGLIKAALVLENRRIPPSLNFSRPNPKLQIEDSPFYVADRPLEWPEGPEPRRAGVTSLGLGGTNAHVVLEEAPPRETSPAARPWQLLVLSARSEAAVARAAENLAHHLRQDAAPDLADAAWTLQAGRRPFRHRRIAVARSVEEAAAALEAPARTFEAGSEAPEVAFLFPGGGTQHAGMGRELRRCEPRFQAALEECAGHLRAREGLDLDSCLEPADGLPLDRPSLALPALFAVEYALARLWMSWGIRPRAVLGHSLGEYVAACLAGVLSLADALSLVTLRGRLFERLPEGSMLSVPLPAAALLPRLGEDLSLAAVNAPSLCVVSGPVGAIDRLRAGLTAEGAEVSRLHIAVAAHSKTVEPILDDLRRFVRRLDLRPPRIPLVSNVTGTWLREDEATDPEYWVRHLRQTVRFADGVGELLRGRRALLEVGPGRVLTTLARQHPDAPAGLVAVTCLPEPRSQRSEEPVLLEALGQLWAAGVPVDWEAFHDGERRGRVPLPTYPFERQRYWLESGKSPAALAPASGRREPSRWLHRLTWKRAPEPPPAASLDLPGRRPWAVFSDGGPFGHGLVARLREAGQDVVEAVPGTAWQAEDYRTLISELRDHGRLPGAVLHLGGLGATDDPEAGFWGLLFLAQALGSEGSADPVRIVAVFDQVHDVTGDEPLRPEKAAVLGPCRVLPQEYPNLSCHGIDLVPPAPGSASEARWIDWILREALATPAETPSRAVAYRGASRWLQDVEEEDLPDPGPAGPPRLRERGVYLITGGMGGVGSELARDLARNHRARLVLTGRTAPGPRSGLIAELESLGAEVLALAADVADAAAMRAVVEAARQRFGRIDGVVHAAGVPPSGMVQTKTPEAAAALLRPKVTGARVLREVLRDDPPGFVVHCSSLSALVGGIGAADHCAANACLDAFARLAGREGGPPTLSIQWDGWRDVGQLANTPVSADLRRSREEALAASLSPAEGVAVFRRALAFRDPVLAVSTLHLKGLLDAPPRGTAGAEAAGSDDAPAGRPGRGVPPGTGEEVLVARIWQEILGVEEVGLHDDFFELGGHSLMAIRLMSRLREVAGVDLPFGCLFETPTVAGLAARVAERRSPARATIPRRDPAAPAPASYSQRGLWFFEQWAPGRWCYHVAVPLAFRGRLHVPALAAGLGEVVRRHESLRTTFAAPSGEPLQVVAPPAPVPLPLVDLRLLPAAARETEARRILAGLEQRPFDLARGPLMRAALLALGPAEHHLAVVFHHIVVDGWSTGLFCEELTALYEAAAAGRPSPLPGLPIQYGDYAAWQRQRLESGALREALERCRRHLDGAPTLVELPADRPRPAVPSHRGAVLAWHMPPRLAGELQEIGRRGGATLFMVLLAAFDTLLHRFTGQEDLVVATPFANRDRPELEPLLGLLVDLVVLRADLSGDPAFSGLLEPVRQTTSEAFAHHELPFEVLVEELRPVRDRSHTPFAQIVFQLEEGGKKLWELPGLTVEPLAIARTSVQSDLILTLFQERDGLTGTLEYSRDLFDDTTAARLIRGYRTLLQAVAAQPGRRLSELPLLDEGERLQALVEWNDTATDYPTDLRLHGLVAAQAARTPEAVAVSFEGASLTYRELTGRARGLARRLVRLGVEPDGRVGVLLDRSLEMMVGLLAVLEAGAAYVPLDPTLPPDRIAVLIAASGASVVLARERHAHLLPGRGERAVLLDRDGTGLDGAPLPERTGEQGLAYVLFTSGSTGTPKGVMIPHRGIVNRLLWMQEAYGLTPGDRVLQKTPFSFDVSVWEFFWPLIAGARLVFARPEGHKDPVYLSEVIAREGITTLHFVPSMLQAFLDGAPGIETLASLRRLRRVMASGEALPVELVRRFFDRLPGVELHNLYGPTEASVDVSFWPCVPEPPRSVVPIGRPIANLRLHVVDRNQRPQPIGVPGELLLGGVGLARGYLARPDLTAAAFVPDPLGGEPGGRLYRTGDLARLLPDGNVEYLGRLDHQVKIRGFRIEPGEIEAVLATHPAVRECVVVAREDTPGERRLVAYVTGDPEPSALRDHLGARLPEYMVPPVFVRLEALPISANGKVDRKALPAPAALPAGEPVLPRTPLEAALAEVWAEVLALDRVGVRDNFFTLGGDSIRTLRVRLQAAKRGLSLSVPELFAHQTIEELARYLEKQDPEPLAETPETAPFALLSPGDFERLPRDLEDAYPAAALQAGMLFHGTLDSAAYHDVFSYHLRAPFDLEALRAAVDALAGRHPVLRTSFELAGFREPLQLVHQLVEVPVLQGEDLRALSAAEQERRLEDWLDGESRRPFDPARPPLLRFALHRRSAETFQLTLVFHHAILDGWSVALLLTELLNGYLDRCRGRQPAPAAPALPYRSFVAEERRAATSEEARRFWTGMVAGAPATVPPIRVVPPSGALMEQAEMEVPLGGGVSEALLRRSEENGLPVKSLLLAVHLGVLGFLCGSGDVVTGLVSHGRLDEEGGTEALGLYLNSLPFRVRLEDGSWLDLARRVAAAEQALLPHRRFPMAEIQRLTGGRPLFETLFNFVHFHVAADLLRSGGVEILAESYRDEATFPFTAQFSRDPAGRRISLYLLYDRRRWSGREAGAFADRYRRALEAVAEDPSAPRDRALGLSAAERHQILVEWNDTRLAGPAAEERLHAAFERRAAADPDAPALAWEGGLLSYGELDRWAGRLARRLHAAGAGPEAPVGLYLERSPAMIAGLLGILKAGAAFLPLDPAYPRERTVLVLEDSRTPLVLTQPELAIDLEEFPGTILLTEADPGSGSGDEAGLPPAPGGESLAYLIYTSGSTGRPKPVAVPHRAAVRHLAGMRRALSLRPPDRVLQFSTLGFDASLDQIFPALSEGACLVLRGPRLWSPRELQDVVEAMDLTVLNLPTAYWSEWARVRSEDPRPAVPDSVRLVYAGGEGMPVEAVESWRACPRNRGVRLLNVYGVTEAVITSAWLDVSTGCGGSAFAPIGRPLGDRTLYVLHPSGAPLPAGTPGELYIGGPALARGYLGRPELTAERFVPDHLGGQPGGLLYRTGDLVRFLDDGRIELLGRIDRQIKVRGIRVEPAEVEAALRSHPGVVEAVVEVRGGQVDARLVAWVVCDRPVGESELREAARRRLPEALVPAAFVFLEALPLTAAGKVDRTALPEPAAGAAAAYVPPGTATEEALCTIWGEVFEHDRIGVEDDFFALGGHSIRATQILARIRKGFRIDLPLRSLFEQPTVAALAVLVDRQIEAAQSVRLEGILAEMDGLSDEEIEALLMAEEGAEENGSSRQ